MPKKFFRPLAATLSFCLLLSACGSNYSSPVSGGSGSGVASAGRFIDDPVQGLQYQSSTQNSLTGAQGDFSYLTGETLRFSIGKVELGSVQAASILSPLSLVSGAQDTSNRAVINIARVLLTLDSDCDASNGIQIASVARQAGMSSGPVNFDQTESAFSNDAAAMSFVNQAKGTCTALVSGADARANLDRSVADAQAHGGQFNHLPVLDNIQDITAAPGAAVSLTGIARDEDGDTLTYAWSKLSGPDITMTGTSTPKLQFTAPASGPLVLRLVVTDGRGGKAQDDVKVLITQPSNQPPVAAAGADQSVNGGANVTLDGSGSSDPDGSITAYQWAQFAGASVGALNTANTVRASFIAPSPATDTTYTFRLTVTDNSGAKNFDDVDIRVSGTPPPPPPPPPPGQSTLSINNVSMQAGTSGTKTFSFTITRGGNTAQASTVHAATADGTATTADNDYDAVPDTTVSFASGETSKPFNVTVHGDSKAEGDETFTVNLSTPSANANITAAQGTGTGTIQQNPTTPPPSAPTGFPVCVPAGAPGAGNCLKDIPTLGPALQGLVDTLYNTVTGGGTSIPPVIAAPSCPSGMLCVGAAKRSVSPNAAQIAGINEDRVVGLAKRNQKFNLGGFGINPTQNLPDPFGTLGEQLTKPAQGVFSNSKGIVENLYVRAFVIEQGNGERLAFITLDAIGAGNVIQKGMMQAVNLKSCAMGACIAEASVVFGQTHSHAGPDLQGLWGGVPQDWIANTLYVQAAEAVAEALRNLQPAKLTVAQGTTNAFNHYRRPKIDPTAISDGTLTLLRARRLDNGAPIGSVLQYNAHPTSIDETPRLTHPDFVLGAMDWLEDAAHFGGTSLYFNGPIADASGSGSRVGCTPIPSDQNYGNVRCRGEGIADAGMSFEEGAALNSTMTVRQVEVLLPVTNPLFIASGLAGTFNRYYDFTELPTEQIPGIGPMVKSKLIDFPQLTPTAKTLVSRITIGGAKGGLDIVTIPGEATNTFGKYLRALNKDNQMMFLGLTHNSFGYIIPEEEFSYIDPSGNDGFTAPFTGYEEFVSLGPLTAPILRTQAYNVLFDQPPEKDVPPEISACQDPKSKACVFTRVAQNVDYIQRSYSQQCISAGGPAAFCAMLNPDTPLYQPCLSAGFDSTVCDVFAATPGPGNNGPVGKFGVRQSLVTLAGDCHDNIPAPFNAICAVPDELLAVYDTIIGKAPSAPPIDAALVAAAADAQVRGCDPLDTTACLYPFPSDYFTVAAPAGSPQSTAKGGTGKRINFNILAMPRNIANKPIDPTEWNRNDGFSPGALIVTLVPGLSLPNTYGGHASGVISIANSAVSLDPDAPIMVLDASDGYKQQLVWAEMDVFANVLLHTPTELQGKTVPGGGQDIPNPRSFQQSLIIRPAKNFEEGHRYIVVLRNLKDGSGNKIKAGPVFQACLATSDSALPPIKARCDALKQNVLTRLPGNIIQNDLFLTWDFTVASKANVTGRLDHMVKDALNSLGGAAPQFTVDTVTANPQTGIAKRIEGTLTVPSYVIPMDPSPQDNSQLQQTIRQITSQFPSQAGDVLAIASTGHVPPNRLFYDPTQAPNQSDPQGSLYGDGLPDRMGGNATMSVPFICQIPSSAGNAHLARAGVYGHGLLDSRMAVTYDGVPELSREHNYMFCAVDFFGFATGDLPNVASSLVDLSNFQVVPDASQQGIVNFAFLARAIKKGFAKNAQFQDANGQALFDSSDVFYDGNSQGGILGAVVVASSPDVNRGVLGSLGMNYSTLLRRSKDFDPYAAPLYLAYQDAYDRNLAFSLMQMLWDRSENDGYAQALRNNPVDQLASNEGHDNFVLLNSEFGDQQVTMWSADVMARTIGIPASYGMNDRAVKNGAQAYPDGTRHPDVEFGGKHVGLQTLDFSDSTQTAASALVQWDVTKDGQFANQPPIVETPPRTGVDPHDNSAKHVSGRCQKAMFLRTDGKIFDITRVEFDGDSCPDLVDSNVSATPPTQAGSINTDGVMAALTRWRDAMTAAFGQFMSDPIGAIQAFLGGNTQLAADLAHTGAQTIGGITGLTVASPTAKTIDTPPALPLQAGAAEGSILVPVGTPLGGYLRPPVGGEYLPGLAALAGNKDPSVFQNEFLNFIPSQADDGEPLLPIPNELRKIHSPYTTWSTPSRGYYDSLMAKAVVLYDGNDYAVLMKTDFIGTLDEVVQAVADRVKADTGIDLHDGLVMSATHTHDGPGALANNSARYFWLAMDVYQPEIFDRVVPQLAKVVEAALADMHAHAGQAARFGYGMGSETLSLNHYRRSIQWYDQTANDAIRNRIGVLRVDREDSSHTFQPLALVMNYAAHGIAFDVENQYFSGDVLASAEREVAASFGTQPVVAMLVQNTAGNVTPGTGDGPTLQRIERWGKRLAPEVRQIYDAVNNFDYAPDIRTVSQRIILDRKHIGYPDTDGKNGDGDYPYAWGAVQCNNDVAVPFVGVGVKTLQDNDPTHLTDKLPNKAPSCLAGPPPDAADLADNGVAENGAFVPQDTRLTAVQIGSALLLAQPGEPLTEYGVRLLKAANDVGYKNTDTFIWGYSQDHVGYIMADEKADWDTGGTEGTTTFWGWKQGDRLIRANVDLMKALHDKTAAPADEFKINYTYQDQLYKNYPKAQPTPSLQPGRLVSKPNTIERFEATSFVWEGGDPVLDAPDVTLMTCPNATDANACVPAKRANGTVLDTFFEMHLKYRLSATAHLWTVEFEAPKDWPTGTYRFKVAGKAWQGSAVSYGLTSAAFAVLPSPSLQLALASSNQFATLTYTPRPQNYRLIDPLVRVDVAAPVRVGTVEFLDSNGAVIETVMCSPAASGTDCNSGIYRRTLTNTIAASARGHDGFNVSNTGAALADADGDGVPDNIDKCPNTPPGATVDANGCSASQQGGGFPVALCEPVTGKCLKDAPVIGAKIQSALDTAYNTATAGGGVVVLPLPGLFMVGTGSALHNPVQPVCVGGGSTNCGRRVDPGVPGAIRDPLLSRATAITGSNNETLIVVTTTNIGYFLAYKPEQGGLNGIYDVRLRIFKATGVPSKNITVVSDHSHSAPDTIGIWGGVSADYMKITADAVVKSAVQAYMSRRSAIIKVAAVNQNEHAVLGVPRLSSSYNIAPGYDPDHGNPTNEFRLLTADDATTGGRILTLVNYAPHATVTNGDKPYRLTGDWVAWAPQEAEKLYGGMGLATVGALGSTDWNKTGDSNQKEAEARARLRMLMVAATAQLQPVLGAEVKVESTFIHEPLAQPFLLLNYKPGADHNNPAVPTDGADVRIDRSVLPPFLTGSVMGTYVSAIRIGDVFISTFPGEPFGELNYAIQNEGRVQGARVQFLLGAANDFFGYMVKKPETYQQAARTGELFLAGCPDHSIERQAGVPYEDTCSDHWTLMASPTIGSHIVCTLQNSADRLGFQTANRDVECPVLTALDGLGTPPESDSPLAGASYDGRNAAVRQARDLAKQCRSTAAPAALCDAIQTGANNAAVYLGVE